MATSGTEQIQRLIRNINLDNLITVENSEDQQKIDELLKSPLKNYQQGLGELYRCLDIGETVFIICDELEFSESSRNEIDLAKGGGGNPAKVLLNKLKQNPGTIRFEAFKRALETFQISLPELESISSFSQLSYSIIKQLSVLLSRDNVWKDVAAELGYDVEVREQIARHQMHPNNYSPAEILFRIIDREMPEYSVKEFMILLHNLRIINSYNHMEKTIKEWARVSADIN